MRFNEFVLCDQVYVKNYLYNTSHYASNKLMSRLSGEFIFSCAKQKIVKGIMQRIDASKLLALLFASNKKHSIKVILSENPIFMKIAEEKIKSDTNNPARYFSEKDVVANFVEYLATGNLFAPPQGCIVTLQNKLTAKQWEEEKKYLSMISCAIEAPIYFFGSTNMRHFLKEFDFHPEATIYLCYEPSDLELVKCVEQLIYRYPTLSQKTKECMTSLANLAIETYMGDLVNIDMHLARMDFGGLTFAQALVGNAAEINAFHVVDAISKNNLFLVELRITQCEHAGEDATGVFMAIYYFLKQVTTVLSFFDESKDFRSAFEKAHIPYPAQARIQNAIKQITKEKLTRFFISAPKIEMELRQQKKPFTVLSAEIANWMLN